jgi:periplasmic protein TonB
MQVHSSGRTESEHATTETALGRCFVDGDTATKVRDRRRRRKALGISFAIEAAVLALLIIAPLMTSIAQPQLNRIFTPMPIIMGEWHAHNSSHEPLPRPVQREFALSDRGFRSPLSVPLANAHESTEPDDAPVPDIPAEYIPGAIQFPDLGSTRSPIEPPSIETHKTNTRNAVKVSEGVQQAQLISRIEPHYPFLAVQTRTQGTVLLHATINLDGHITALEVVSGPPLLVQAAVDAVRQWRYRPTYLSGEPVEVETSITVVFRLGP